MVPVLYPAVAASSSLPFAFQLLTIIHRRGETSGRLPSPHRLPRTPIHGSPLPPSSTPTSWHPDADDSLDNPLSPGVSASSLATSSFAATGTCAPPLCSATPSRSRWLAGTSWPTRKPALGRWQHSAFPPSCHREGATHS